VKILKGIAVALALVVLGLVGLYVVMAERGEVVVLHTHGADGDHETRVWVVDDAEHAWLRTGASNATWLPRLRASSAVEVERAGRTSGYDAVVVFDPAAVARVNELTLAKYGWSEQLLRATGMNPAGQVAIRLDPRPEAGDTQP
jgi:hypothetical protein